MPGGYMNPAYGSMMEGAKSADRQSEGPAAKHEEGKRAAHDVEPHHRPHIGIHTHHHPDGAVSHHTVVITHHDGRVEDHRHEAHDTDGIAAHIHEHLGEGAAPEGHESAGGEEMLAGER
jgi:hypothetical protein